MWRSRAGGDARRSRQRFQFRNHPVQLLDERSGAQAAERVRE
ncbi:MAG TPA: hypothetical protein VIL18_01570 [Longimicrobiales bacterium]